MTNVISELKSVLTNGVPFKNKYRVILNFPNGISSLKSKTLNTLCQNASLLSRKVNASNVWCRGRRLTVRNEQEYTESFELTFIEDMNMSVRKNMEVWLDFIDNYNGKILDHDKYKTEVIVQQLDMEEKPIYSYRFYDVFITEIGQLDFNDSSQNENVITSCTFSCTKYELYKDQ